MTFCVDFARKRRKKRVFIIISPKLHNFTKSLNSTMGENMEIIFANFGEIYSYIEAHIKSFFLSIAPYFFSIITMVGLMLLKKSLRVLYYGSKRNEAKPNDKAKSNLRRFFKKFFKEDTTGRTPGTLWHIIWLIIIFGAGSIILAYFLISQTQNLFQRTDNTRQLLSGIMRMFGMHPKPDLFRIIKGIASFGIVAAYLGIFQALLWRIIRDVRERDPIEKAQNEDEETEEEQEKIANLKPLRRVWVTSWTAIFLIIFFTYLNTYFGTIPAAVIIGVIGISCQTPLKAIVGWITLIIRQKFKKGMDVQIGDFKGEIDGITPLAVVIKEAGETKREIHIPTSTLFDQIIIDLSLVSKSDLKPAKTKPESEDVTQY